MSTILNTKKENDSAMVINPKATGKFHIVNAEWNSHITHPLRNGAYNTLLGCGVDEKNIVITSVPGTVELVNAAALLARQDDTEAVIILGCIIRGDTPHFDYVCMIAAQGCTLLNAEGKTPVIFGVLTTDNEEQALERAGGRLGNKGAEAAETAVAMANLHASFK